MALLRGAPAQQLGSRCNGPRDFGETAHSPQLITALLSWSSVTRLCPFQALRLGLFLDVPGVCRNIV